MWVVDTCVIVDVFEGDPLFAQASASLIKALAPQGLCVNSVTMVELTAAFKGNFAAQEKFLTQAGIDYTEAWHVSDTKMAHAAWHAFVSARRSGQTPRRPIADILIGAFAMNRSGLITRNPDDFRRWFPKLAIKEPRP